MVSTLFCTLFLPLTAIRPHPDFTFPTSHTPHGNIPSSGDSLAFHPRRRPFLSCGFLIANTLVSVLSLVSTCSWGWKSSVFRSHHWVRSFGCANPPDRRRVWVQGRRCILDPPAGSLVLVQICHEFRGICLMEPRLRKIWESGRRVIPFIHKPLVDRLGFWSLAARGTPSV